MFELTGRSPDRYVHVVPVDASYDGIFFSDGSRLDYGGDAERMFARVQDLSPGDVEGYLTLAQRVESIFAKGFGELADQPFLHVADMVKVVPDLVRLQLYRSVCGLVSHFVRETEPARMCPVDLSSMR